MPHVIRLKAAWNRSVADKIERVNLPDAPIATDGASVIYTRSFNAPSGISSTTEIDFVVQSWMGELSLQLDGHSFITAIPWQGEQARFSLRGELSGHHNIRIELMGKLVGLTGICELEIEPK